jgi:hypothetical protein
MGKFSNGLSAFGCITFILFIGMMYWTPALFMIVLIYEFESSDLLVMNL